MSGDSPAGDATQSSGSHASDRPPLSKDVFVSYASQDAAVANSVVEALESQGIRCWIAPRDVTPGEFYAGVIVHAIDAAKATVLILSQHSAASPHVVREVERAASKRHPVISLRIDRAPLPADLEYFLNTSQWLDASDEEPSRVFRKLVEAVRKVLAGGSATTSGNAIPSESVRESKRRSFNHPLAVALAVVGVAIVAFAIERFWFSKHVATEKTMTEISTAVAFAPPPHSIAVLPFVNMSGDASQEYFSDGISEELLNALASIKELQVVGRTSSFSFKGQNVDISTIAHKLNVGAVLEGSVRRAGNTVRITVQLIDALSGFHLWSQTYDRNLGDILKVQTTVAESVAQQLKITLVANKEKEIEARQIRPDTYTFYLQGRQILRGENTKAALDNAAELFRQSVTADPGFAEGWLYLEIALSNEVIDNIVKPEVVAAEMRHAADTVVALEPGSVTAHRALAQIYWSLDWNWLVATAEYKRAYELNPGNSIVVRQFAEVTYVILVDETTALSLYRRAIELDPLNSFAYLAIGNFYIGMGKLPEAESAFRQALAINPKAPATASLCQILVTLGKATEALALVQRMPDDTDRRWCAALAYQRLGRKTESDAALADAERLDAEQNAYSIAEIHAYRGEIDQAFAWLDRAYRQRDFSLTNVKVDPLLNALKVDPRYKPLLHKMHLSV